MVHIPSYSLAWSKFKASGNCRVTWGALFQPVTRSVIGCIWSASLPSALQTFLPSFAVNVWLLKMLRWRKQSFGVGISLYYISAEERCYYLEILLAFQKIFAYSHVTNCRGGGWKLKIPFWMRYMKGVILTGPVSLCKPAIVIKNFIHHVFLAILTNNPFLFHESLLLFFLSINPTCSPILLYFRGSTIQSPSITHSYH